MADTKRLTIVTVNSSGKHLYYCKRVVYMAGQVGGMGTFFIPDLEVVYIVSGMGCLPRRDDFHPRFLITQECMSRIETLDLPRMISLGTIGMR